MTTSNTSVIASEIAQSQPPVEASTSNPNSPTSVQRSFWQKISDLVIPLLVGVAVGLVLIFGFGVESLVAIGISFVATILTFCFGDKIGLVANRSGVVPATLTTSSTTEQASTTVETATTEQTPTTDETVTPQQTPTTDETVTPQQTPTAGETATSEQTTSIDEIVTPEQDLILVEIASEEHASCTDDSLIGGVSTLDTTVEVSSSAESHEEDDSPNPMLTSQNRTGLRWVSEQVVNLGEGIQDLFTNLLS